MIKNVALFLSVLCTHLMAVDVDIVSSFNVDHLDPKCLDIKRIFNVRYVCPSDYFVKISPFDSNLRKIIVFDPFFNREVIPKLPKNKLVLFVWEPGKLQSEIYDMYSKVYTWDDSLVDGKKFFRFNYPSLMPMRRDIPAFEDKKLCTMVAGNWTKDRLEVLKFFDKKKKGDLEFYGRCPEGFKFFSMYKGPIPGFHSGDEKLSVLKNYKFCICFENTSGLQGYITEKIFCCFAAGSIPIYLGAANITQYIPKSCFIDFRDFQSKEELYQYIKNMPKDVYQKHIDEIKRYLKSSQAQLFSPEFFNSVLYDAITSNGS